MSSLNQNFIIVNDWYGDPVIIPAEKICLIRQYVDEKQEPYINLWMSNLKEVRLKCTAKVFAEKLQDNHYVTTLTLAKINPTAQTTDQAVEPLESGKIVRKIE